MPQSGICWISSLILLPMNLYTCVLFKIIGEDTHFLGIFLNIFFSMLLSGYLHFYVLFKIITEDTQCGISWVISLILLPGYLHFYVLFKTVIEDTKEMPVWHFLGIFTYINTCVSPYLCFVQYYN